MSKLLITGGNGFLGQHVRSVAPIDWEVLTPTRDDLDLEYYEWIADYFCEHRPDFVIHCAGYNGGIDFNKKYPADILDRNTGMAINLYKCAQVFKVKKMVSVITSCAYPDGPHVLKEDTLWDGLPNDTIRGHGIAKRMLQALAEQYNKQYGCNFVCAAITNLYGIGDTFNLGRTKVVGAIIRKVVEAYQFNQPYIECWGTGAPLREFMYVRDAAHALMSTLHHYNDYTKPLNIGSNVEISIKELVDLIVKLVGYEGEVRWLKDRGDGQMRKLLDSSTMRDLFDTYITPLEDGLKKTIDWYIANKKKVDERI